MSKHGTRARFINSGCRCLPCRAADTRYKVEWTRKKRAGTLRRRHSTRWFNLMIYFLKAEGFTKKEIARRMGITKLTVGKKVQPRTQARMEAFFNYYVKEEQHDSTRASV